MFSFSVDSLFEFACSRVTATTSMSSSLSLLCIVVVSFPGHVVVCCLDPLIYFQEC